MSAVEAAAGRVIACTHSTWYISISNASHTRHDTENDHREDDGDDFDAYDQENVATDPANADVLKQHAQMVRDGWTKLRPQH